MLLYSVVLMLRTSEDENERPKTKYEVSYVKYGNAQFETAYIT